MKDEKTNIQPDDDLDEVWRETSNEPTQPGDPDEEIPSGDNDEDFGIIVEPDQGLIEWQHERIIITTTTYRKFMALDDGTGLWTDAYLLYNHFYFTARTQETNQIWANRTYCKKGLHWGQEKYKKAFGFLLKYGFIEQVRREKAEKGQFPKVYIKVNYLSNSTVDPNRSKVKEVTVDPKPIDPDRSAKCFKEEKNNVRRGSNDPEAKPPTDSPIIHEIKSICKRLKVPIVERDQWLNRHDPPFLIAQLRYTDGHLKTKPVDNIVRFIQSAIGADYAKYDEAVKEAEAREQEAKAKKEQERQVMKDYDYSKIKGIPPEAKAAIDRLTGKGKEKAGVM